jgi:lysophospholipase L1-like esterase
MRLLVRGGSIAAGLGVVRGYTDILRDHYTPLGIEVVNRSRAGDTSFDGLWSFEEDIDPFRPDMLILHFGIDDAYGSVYRSEFKENLVRIVRRSRERFQTSIFLLTSQILDDRSDMDTVGIYYRSIREVSQDLACEMIPIHTFWAGYLSGHGLRNSDLVQQDTRYPNERGHEVFAEAIIRRLDREMAVSGPGT